MLLEEIWGCVNCIKIPYETVMSMPVYDRKNWIARHNLEVAEENEKRNSSKDGNVTNISGEMINGLVGQFM